MDKGHYRVLCWELPDDQNVMRDLIEAIPPDWAYVDGWLEAPRPLVESGAALDYACVIGRKVRRPLQRRPEPDLFDSIGARGGETDRRSLPRPRSPRVLAKRDLTANNTVVLLRWIFAKNPATDDGVF